MSAPAGTGALLGARLNASELSGGEVTRTCEADAGERRAIAERLGVEAIDALTARITAVPDGHGAVTVTGEVEARLTQLCVVTLEPVAATVTAGIDERFVPSAAPPGEGRGPRIVDIDNPDDGEPLDDGVIDIASLVVDALATAIDPYPRAPGAEFAAPDGAGGEDDAGEASPFAALAALKSGKPAP
jgi:uncharacterized metal-binding protein YceD (DUF177 family)